MCARARSRFISVRALSTGTVRALYGHCTGTVQAVELLQFCANAVDEAFRPRRRPNLLGSKLARPALPGLVGTHTHKNTHKNTHTHTHTRAHNHTHAPTKRTRTRARTHAHPDSTQTRMPFNCFNTSLFLCQVTTLWGTGEGKKIATFFKMSSALTYNSQHPSPPIQC